MTKGFVCLHRSIFNSPHFKKEPYCEIAAFSWMIAQASHKKTSVRYKDRVFDLERGQFACSVRDMAEKLSWHRSKVDRFLNRLVKDGVIKTETGPRHQANKVTICNYDEYQNSRDTVKPQPETPPRHLRDTSETENNHLTTEPLNHEEEEGTNVPTSKPADFDPSEFATMWNEICGGAGLPRVRDLKGNRLQKARKRWDEDFGASIAQWGEFCHRVTQSDFLSGRTKEWAATFDWCLEPRNVTKILEGNYDNKLTATASERIAAQLGLAIN